MAPYFNTSDSLELCLFFLLKPPVECSIIDIAFEFDDEGKLRAFFRIFSAIRLYSSLCPVTAGFRNGLAADLLVPSSMYFAYSTFVPI